MIQIYNCNYFYNKVKVFPLKPSFYTTHAASLHDVLNLLSILSLKCLASPAHPTLSLCITIYKVSQSERPHLHQRGKWH